MVLLILPMVAPLHLYQGRNKDWKFGERAREMISKTSGLERAGQTVHRAVRTGGARGAIRSKTFYSKKALDYYLPPQIFSNLPMALVLKKTFKLNLGYNQLDKYRPICDKNNSNCLIQGQFLSMYLLLTVYFLSSGKTNSERVKGQLVLSKI